MRPRRLAATVLLAGSALAGGCTATARPVTLPPTPLRSTATPLPVTAAPTATVTAPLSPAPARTSPAAQPVVRPWVVGASPLPLGAGGFGRVLPTPEVLRNRHLQAADVLPPPPDGRFHATVTRIDAQVRRRMGTTWRPGCPVPLRDLRYLTLGFRGFDGRTHTGELVVATKVAEPVVGIFRRLFELGFPLEQMRIATTADLTAAPTGDGNDTSGFVCRRAIGQTRFSAHAYGLAIDVDPFQNPFVRDGLVLPELASSYTHRSHVRDGMFEPGSPEVRAFTDAGWTWGGDFHRPKDYQHFSLTGD